MFKKALFACSIFALSLTSCGDDDSNDLDYPLTANFVETSDKGTIEIWTNVNGTLESVDPSDTEVDNNTGFTESTDEETFKYFQFTSESEVLAHYDFGGLLFGDESMTYTTSDDKITFTATVDDQTVTLVADGTPEDFKIDAKAIIVSNAGGSDVSIESGLLTTEVEEYKADLEEGYFLVVQSYKEVYRK